jgi:2-dehydro-3-deoxygalactonokinase
MTTDSDKDLCLICVDAGTTNTRVWLTRGDEIVADARAGVGVRDTARDGSPERLRAALGELIARVRSEGQAPDAAPRAVVAAGMITSPLGLCEVPHIAAPASVADLSASVERHSFPDVTELPVLLVPGVRSGPARCDRDSIGEADVMRGEETLCAGLVALGLLGPGATLLNLGSHWKLISLDGAARIAASVTSLTGELIHATQTETILADAVPHAKPEHVDFDYLAAGMREQRRAGLARALFCVRLLEQRGAGSPQERLSFLIGAYLAADLDAMTARGLIGAGQPVVITGGGAVAGAWVEALKKVPAAARALDAEEVEQAFLVGLRMIARELNV